MSEISYYETSIQIPRAQVVSETGNLIDGDIRLALLKRALQIVAEDHGGSITNDIRNADNGRISCLTGVTTNNFPRGIGVQIDEQGHVAFVYETRDDERQTGKMLAGEISANYNAIAIQQALQKMNVATQVHTGRTQAGVRQIRIVGEY